MSSTLILPDRELAESDPVTINDEIGSITDLIVDGGVLAPNPTTVVIFEDSVPIIKRYGAGDTAPFE